MDTRLQSLIENSLKQIDGWCPLPKALKLAEHILLHKPKGIVEIGVFGGASLIPMALALQLNGSGKVYGIDPWTIEATVEGTHSKINNEWWTTKSKIEMMYGRVQNWVSIYQLQPYVELIKNKAENVINNFGDGTIDLLHIDGNHSKEMSMKDAVLYYPKVRPGGFIAFDDSGWVEEGLASTIHALEFLENEGCEEVDKVGDCVILLKPLSTTAS